MDGIITKGEMLFANDTIVSEYCSGNFPTAPQKIDKTTGKTILLLVFNTMLWNETFLFSYSICQFFQ
jgi:hypothetical protein